MRTIKKRFNAIAYLLAIPAIMACGTDPIGPTTSTEAGCAPSSEQPVINRDEDNIHVEGLRAQPPPPPPPPPPARVPTC